MSIDRSTSRFRPAWPRGCWPTDSQESLLRACLLEDRDAAQEAFHNWSRRVPLFFVDSGSQMLLLLLHERLRDWNVDYADMQRLQGLARYYWVRHQSLARQLHELALAFQDAGLDMLLLKGAALNATVYTGRTRLMSDLDVAVQRPHADQAMAMLQRLGWTPQFRQPERLAAVTHGCHLRRGEGELDLHWDFFHGRPLDDEGQRAFWEASLPIALGGAAARVLCPTDQLLHTCEHGLRSNDTPPFRWLADACLIVRGGGIDWQRLAMLAERFQLLAAVEATLHYLDERLATPIPQAAFAALAARRTSLAGRLEYFVTTRRMPGSHPFWRGLPSNLFSYARARRAHPGLTLGQYLTVVNDFEPPLGNNLRRLVQLQTLACARSAIGWATSCWNAARGDAKVIHIDLSDHTWENFFPPEAIRRATFRWSKTSASVLLPVRDAGYTVVVRLFPVRSWHSDLQRHLTLRINRAVVPPDDVRFSDGNVSFDIEPQMLVDYHSQRLELRCAKWDGAIGDPRELGVPVREILLQPKAA